MDHTIVMMVLFTLFPASVTVDTGIIASIPIGIIVSIPSSVTFYLDCNKTDRAAGRVIAEIYPTHPIR
jgi:hypothetical protein